MAQLASQGEKRLFNGNDLPDTYRNGSVSFQGNAGNFFNQNTQSDNASRTGSANSQNARRGPKYPQYSITCIRHQTFQSWPSSIQQHPETMAEAGFYYTGNNDHVRCFHCGIGLQNWDSEDNPFVEHARWSSDCQYLKDKKGLDFISTVQDAVRRVQMEEALTNDGIAETFESDTEEDGNARSEDTDKDLLPNGRRPSKAEKKNPLLTDAAQSILTMGYLPKYIRIVIDKVLQEKGWTGMTSRNLMEEIIKIEEEIGKDKDRMLLPTGLSSRVKENVVHIKRNMKTIPKDEINRIAEENKEMKEQSQCKICCEDPVSIVFLPCGHLTACSQCAPALKSCPVCRTEIKGSVKVIFNK